MERDSDSDHSFTSGSSDSKFVSTSEDDADTDSEGNLIIFNIGGNKGDKGAKPPKKISTPPDGMIINQK